MGLRVQIVSLEDYYANIHRPEAQQFFLEMTALRAASYGPDYPSHYLPLDQSDFVATHHLFCLENQGKWEVFGGLRHLHSSILAQYRLTLPLLASVRDSGSTQHFAALQDLMKAAGCPKQPDQPDPMDQAEQLDREILYSSRFVLKKEIRSDRTLAARFKEMVAGLTYADFIHFNKPRILAGSALRFKTQSYFEQVGFRPLAWDNQVLPPFHNDLSGEDILLMKVDEISAWAKSCFEKHQFAIESRQRIAVERAFIPSEWPARVPKRTTVAA